MYIPIFMPIPNLKHWALPIPIPCQCGDFPSKSGQVLIIPRWTGLFVISTCILRCFCSSFIKKKFLLILNDLIFTHCPTINWVLCFGFFQWLSSWKSHNVKSYSCEIWGCSLWSNLFHDQVKLEEEESNNFKDCLLPTVIGLLRTVSN